MYVISEDICILLQDWAKQRRFSVPTETFFSILRDEMKDVVEEIFGLGNVDFVKSQVLVDGLNQLVNQVNDPIVSLDKTYFKSKFTIETSRAVDECLNDVGSVARYGCKSVEQQVCDLRKSGFNKVTLLDDVIFSGGVMMEIFNLCKSQGIGVSSVISAVCIGEGYKTIIQEGVNVLSVISYNEVVDEICERDFYPGIPMSGRTVKSEFVNLGAPYLYPFGRPIEWASIPTDKVETFSQFCIHQSIRLWKEVEKVSGKVVSCSDLERIPIGAPYDDSRFVDYLASLISN